MNCVLKFVSLIFFSLSLRFKILLDNNFILIDSIESALRHSVSLNQVKKDLRAFPIENKFIKDLKPRLFKPSLGKTLNTHFIE